MTVAAERERSRWAGMVTALTGLGSFGAMVVAFALDERLFGSDPTKDNAYTFAAIVGSVAAVAVVRGFRGWREDSNRTLTLTGLLLGLLALAATGLFVFGTMLVGG